MSWESEVALSTDKQLVTEAFKALRQQGYTTRQNFSCCGGCAMSELAAEVEQGKNHDKFVTYNRQNGEAFNDRGQLMKSLMITWDGSSAEIVKAFESVGLMVAEHAGDKELCVEVYPFRATDWRAARKLFNRLHGRHFTKEVYENPDQAINDIAAAMRASGIVSS